MRKMTALLNQPVRKLKRNGIANMLDRVMRLPSQPPMLNIRQLKFLVSAFFHTPWKQLEIQDKNDVLKQPGRGNEIPTTGINLSDVVGWSSLRDVFSAMDDRDVYVIKVWVSAEQPESEVNQDKAQVTEACKAKAVAELMRRLEPFL